MKDWRRSPVLNIATFTSVEGEWPASGPGCFHLGKISCTYYNEYQFNPETSGCCKVHNMW
jgi:hypothetical protein